MIWQTQRRQHKYRKERGVAARRGEVREIRGEAREVRVEAREVRGERCKARRDT